MLRREYWYCIVISYDDLVTCCEKMTLTGLGNINFVVEGARHRPEKTWKEIVEGI